MSDDPIRNPLAQPCDGGLLDAFRERFGLESRVALQQQLAELVRAFAAVPYENLTKIIKWSECKVPSAARRGPQEVLQDFHRWGTGGTCFSLTAALLHLVRTMGLEADPILADRRYGADTHCALIVWIEGQPHLLDPGYLIVDPIPLQLPGGHLVVATRFNQLELVRRGTDQLDSAHHPAGRSTLSIDFQDDSGRVRSVSPGVGRVLCLGDDELPGAHPRH